MYLGVQDDAVHVGTGGAAVWLFHGK